MNIKMDLNTFTVEELKLECKKKNIFGYSKLRKDELIELLEESKEQELYYYTDPIGWGENIIKSMSKRKEWIYLEPEQRDKRFNAIKIIKGGKWNLYWKTTPFIYFPNRKIPLYYLEKPHKEILQIVNHFPNIEGIATKIGLTESLKKYKKEFEHIFPKTFIIRDRNDKNIYKQILSLENNYWIVKPDKEYGGLGIKFFDNSKKAIDFVDENIKKGLVLEDYRKENKNVKEIKKDGWIIQQYIKNPFLYKGRKFDIRIHILVKDSGEIYFCKYGYIRISSLPFTLQLSEKDEENAMIHITNQAYQETSELFGKFEEGNTLLLEDFMKYLQEEYGVKKGKSLYNELLEDWKEISKLIIEKTWTIINKKTKEVPNRRYYELIGLDYMIDEDFNTWLIEANFNPALNDKTSWGREIVPQVLEETIEICVDPIFNGKVPKKLKWFEQI
jgi:hypothetical protein